MASNYTQTTNEIRFVFPTPAHAENFKDWLCNQGEQDFWEVKEFREGEERKLFNIDFNYHHAPNTVMSKEFKDED